MNNITMGKISSQFADNFVEERIDVSNEVNDKKTIIEDKTSLHKLKLDLKSLIDAAIEEYKTRSTKELYDFIVTIESANKIEI